jgi:transporter family-2 protein
LKKNLKLAIAFTSGVLLAVMISLNARLSAFTTPFYSSLMTHLVGTMAAIVFLLPNGRLQKKEGKEATPYWAYIGGAIGAISVILANITVNSSIALTGTVSLMILGQTLFMLIVDQFGFFGMKRRQLDGHDIMSLTLILIGSFLVFIK